MKFAAIAEEDERHVIETVFGPRTFTRKADEALHPERESLESLKVLLPSSRTITSANAKAHHPIRRHVPILMTRRKRQKYFRASASSSSVVSTMEETCP